MGHTSSNEGGRKEEMGREMKKVEGGDGDGG